MSAHECSEENQKKIKWYATLLSFDDGNLAFHLIFFRFQCSII